MAAFCWVMASSWAMASLISHFLLARGHADLLQQRSGLFHRGQRFVHAGAGLLGLARAGFHVPQRLLDELAHLARGRRGALRQRPHFGGHHRETAALLAGAGGFDRGVERQDIGLEGHAFDDLDDAADAVGRAGDVLHGVGHALHGFVAAPRDCRGLLGQGGAFAGELSGLLGGAVDLLHRRGGLVQALGLGFGALGQIAVADGDFLRAAAQVGHFVPHVAHDRAHAHGQLGQRQLQPTHVAGFPDFDEAGQVARGQAVGRLQNAVQRADEVAPDHAHGQRGRDDGRHPAQPLRRAQRHDGDRRQGGEQHQQVELPMGVEAERALQAPQRGVEHHLAMVQHMAQAAAGGFLAHQRVQALGRLDFLGPGG